VRGGSPGGSGAARRAGQGRAAGLLEARRALEKQVGGTRPRPWPLGKAGPRIPPLRGEADEGRGHACALGLSLL